MAFVWAYCRAPPITPTRKVRLPVLRNSRLPKLATIFL
nr:MAG TPA: hypothetical protein [Caudoviricetes sp.]